MVDTSRSIANMSRELGLNETIQGYWVKAYRERHAGEGPPLGVSERARLRELERRNRDLEMENAFPKKTLAAFGMSFAWRSSRTSRSNSTIRRESAVVTPGR